MQSGVYWLFFVRKLSLSGFGLALQRSAQLTTVFLLFHEKRILKEYNKTVTASFVAK
jgi:hypothetical protein